MSWKGNESRFSLSRLPLFWKLHIAGCLLLFFGLFPLRLFLIPYETELLGSLQRHAYYLIWCDITCFLLAIGLRYLYRLEYFYRISRVSLGIHIVFISAALALIDIGLTFPVFSLVERLQTSRQPASLHCIIHLAALLVLHNVEPALFSPQGLSRCPSR